MTFLRTFFRRCSNVLGLISLLFLALMMFGITFDAFVRTVFGTPITGVFEFSEISMVIIVFLGLGWTQLDDAHIRVTILRQRLSWRPACIVDSLAWAVATVALVILAMPATEEAIHSFGIREFRWGHIEFPIWWAKIALAVGLWFGAAQMACHALHTLFAPRPHATEVTNKTDMTASRAAHH